MTSDATVYLQTFERHVARAVVTVLSQAGVPAWLKESGAPLPGLEGDEVTVLVPQGRREEAMAVLVTRMEQIREEATMEMPLRPTRRTSLASHPLDDEEDGPPLVMERLRRMGFLALLLAPLLVVTLAVPQIPPPFAVVLFVGSLVALNAWQNRGDPEEDPPEDGP